MARKITVAIDAMGGDHDAEFVIPGIAIAFQRHSDVEVLIFGDQQKIAARLADHPKVAAVATVHHAEISISMDEKPSQALRRGRRKASMWKAIDAVKQGEADFVVSAGNTGALMAMAGFLLKPMAKIGRPAMAALWPTVRGESIVLDVGATIGANSQQLINYAVMGAALARSIFNVERPTVGLLNIGVEEVKGLEEVRDAGRTLREIEPPFDYRGFVEGNDVGQGVVDVVVTEGFSGNIALKTAEGTARQIGAYLRAAMQRSIWSRLGYLVAYSAFQTLREKMDPRKSNGAVFLGLNGLVIKSHGGTDATGFASAIDLGIDMARNNLIDRIAVDIDAFHTAQSVDGAPAKAESS
ncbi:MAG: phosphate acyltransferase PlsX [Alphaproteobacteria bacterium]